MKARREFRNRDRVQVAILDTLVDRSEYGMTVFEVRSHVDADIDELETALSDLKADDLITVTTEGNRTLIKPDERIIPDETTANEEDNSLLDRIRERFPL